MGRRCLPLPPPGPALDLLWTVGYEEDEAGRGIGIGIGIGIGCAPPALRASSAPVIHVRVIAAYMYDRRMIEIRVRHKLYRMYQCSYE